MDEIKGLLGKVSEGLQALGDIFTALGKQLERKAESGKTVEEVVKPKAKAPGADQGKVSAEKKPQKVSPVKKKAVAKKKSVPASPPKQANEPLAAYTLVFEIIKNTEGGAGVDLLMEKTGFNQKKIANCVYKLKNNRKIKSSRKGIYIAI